MFSDRGRTSLSRRAIVALIMIAFPLATLSRAARPLFYPDDPIAADNDRAFDASGAAPIEGSNGYDFAEHTFLKPGQRVSVRAANINTIDEVPDSTWFTNRIGREPMSSEDIARGPNQTESLNVDGWPIVAGKSSGITPGYRVTDPSGHLYQIKFDPPDNPEMGSGAEVIGAAFYHALGYNVVQGYIVEIDPEKIVIAPTATTIDMTGRKKRMEREDVDRVLKRAARQANGKYRAIASRYADGKPVGYFKYYGTRSDDPNDIYLHEHRRELRGNRVFAAWLNHDDSRGLNSLDMLEGPEGHRYLRHYMFDFGSIMGSGSTRAQAPRAGNEYILEWKPSLTTFATLGFWLRPWIQVRYPHVARSVGRFEADFFNPVAWKPEYPNPAFDDMQPDDAFWAARLVAKFSDDAIRAVVARARYTEAGATDYTAATLIKRRDKVLRTWLTGVNPIVEPRLAADGTFSFENAAVTAGIAPPPTRYELTWSRFDNATAKNVGDSVQMSMPSLPSHGPPAIVRGSEFLSVAVRTVDTSHPEWNQPVNIHFRRSPEGWKLVGLSHRQDVSAVAPSR